VDHIWLHADAGDLATEKLQAGEEGRDLSSVSGLFAELEQLAPADLLLPANQRRAFELLDRVQELPLVPGYPFDEPSDLEGIRARRRPGPALPALAMTDEQLLDRLHGAWVGRCCGCLLGKPVEGWRRPRMSGYLSDLGRMPLDRYFTAKVPEEIIARYDLHPGNGALIENVSAMPEDDDTNYTVVGLSVLQRSGLTFTPADVAAFWLGNIPAYHVCTAERIAYRNFMNAVDPPASAACRNPYREWIGAQIRADAFGYAAPGNPQLAAEFAWRDASISHVKNGIYGEMWVAAMLAAAFVLDDVSAIVRAGLAQVPERSRLVESVDRVLGWYEAGVTYDEACERVHGEWDENTAHGWCHTISNAMVVAIGLLWGEGDYALSICRAVQPCFDTDCNGATVGSILGVLKGRKALPEEWTAPIQETLETGIAGYHRVSLVEMAQHTLEIARKAVGR
jgi:ADP-ribosylglycohydrolase